MGLYSTSLHLATRDYSLRRARNKHTCSGRPETKEVAFGLRQMIPPTSGPPSTSFTVYHFSRFSLDLSHNLPRISGGLAVLDLHTPEPPGGDSKSPCPGLSKEEIWLDFETSSQHYTPRRHDFRLKSPGIWRTTCMDMPYPRSMIAPKVLSRVGTLQQGTRLPMLVKPLHILTSLSLVGGVPPLAIRQGVKLRPLSPSYTPQVVVGGSSLPSDLESHFHSPCQAADRLTSQKGKWTFA